MRSSPPGVGGVFQDKSFSGTAACPARQVCGLTHAMLGAMRVRDSPPKGLPLAFCNTAIHACQPQNPRHSSLESFFSYPARWAASPPVRLTYGKIFFNLTLVAKMLD